MEISEYYKTGRYTKAEVDVIRKFAKTRIKYLSRHLEKTNPKKILELGCGEGSLAYEIKVIIDAQVYGLDISSSSIKLAKKKGIIARKADINKGIPFKDNTFDLVFSNQVIEHIYNTDIFLKESIRVLKKGGYFIVITPNISFWLNRLVFPFGIYPIFLEVSLYNKTPGMGFLKKFMFEKDAVGHIRVFNLSSLIDMLKFYKFKIEKIEGIPFSFQMPKFLGFFYFILDWIFSKKPSFARDIMIIAKK